MAFPRHLLSVDELGARGILGLLDRAEALRVQGAGGEELRGKVLGLLFFQPSTRTRFGFHAAMARLGGSAIELREAKGEAGMSRAESLADTVRCMSEYCDLIVLRHGSREAFDEALSSSRVPVVCGGAGQDLHPTQALIDLNAIRMHFGCIAGLAIGLIGNLAHSRAVRSLVRALRFFPPSCLRLIAPEGVGLSPWAEHFGVETRVEETSTLRLEGLDVIYMAGLPEQTGNVRFEEPTREKFRLTRERAATLAPRSLILDPLPRIDEIDPEVDELPQAGYFQQSAAGLSVRMAVLQSLLQESER